MEIPPAMGKNNGLTVEPQTDVSLIEVPAQIHLAAEKSLAATLLPRLPSGYEQMLGKRFEGGIDLSGGEWQKVALGRAYMRGRARLLILDEPTAALDARAEFEQRCERGRIIQINYLSRACFLFLYYVSDF